MKTLEEYITDNGFAIEDFNDNEIAELEKELEAINSGHYILDGVIAQKEEQKTIQQYRIQL